MIEPAIEGGCLCGAIRYAAGSRPLDSMICHCRTCRKAAGSPVVGWVTFPAGELVFRRGEPAVFHSSPGVIRTFCGACGSPLTYVHAERPDEIDVTTCSLDDPEAFPPSHHSWLVDHVGWIRFDDGLPAYPRTGPEP